MNALKGICPAIVTPFDRRGDFDAVAMRVITTTGSALYFLHTDHLGSVSLTTDGSGAVVSEQRYTAWGVVWSATGAGKTDIGFTGQRADSTTGLMFYQARYYSPYLNRWLSPDTIVPQAGNPQALNRYAYNFNNPLKYIDPSGHEPCLLAEDGGESYCGETTPPPPPPDPLVEFLIDIVESGPIGRVIILDGGQFLVDTTIAAHNAFYPPPEWSLTDRIANNARATLPVVAVEGILAAPVYFAQAATACAASDCANKASVSLQSLPKVTDLRLSDTVARHANDLTAKGIQARPYINSNLVVQEIMNAAPGIADPQGVPNAFFWNVPGAFNGRPGTWELVVNVKDNIIYHFLFTTKR